MKSGLAGMIVGVVLVARIATGGEPVVVARGEAAARPQQPQVAVEPSGTIHLAFGRGNTVLYSRSKDGARTFSEPVPLPGKFVLSLGKRRGPRIAVAGDAAVVAFIGGEQGRGRDGDVLVCTTADGGQTWTVPVRVNDVADSAREGLHAMAAGPGGEVCCAWLDLRNRKTEIYAATSQDGGRSWGENVLVYRSPDGSVCECCHPSVAYDATGKLYVLWRNSLAGNRDMYLASSSDGGKSFGQAEKLGTGSWKLDACPMDGGSLALAHDGKLFTAWRRDREVFLTAPGQDEARLGAGSQPWIAATGRGPYVAWLEDRTGRLLLHSPGEDKAAAVDQEAIDPVIAASPDGQGAVVLAWERPAARGTEVVCQVVAP